MRRHSCSENAQAGWKRLAAEHAAAHRHRHSSLRIPPPNQDPDIKGRWSETMKLQVRCQLPFETKHSPNPGKTQPVPGIRTNKEELKGEWQKRWWWGWEEWWRRFYGPCWQYGISIKGPNSALNYPPLLLTHITYCTTSAWRRKGCLQDEVVVVVKKNLHVHKFVFTHTNTNFPPAEQYFSYTITSLVSFTRLYFFHNQDIFGYVMEGKQLSTF